MLRAASLLVILSAALPARAAEPGPLVSRWDRPVRYHLEAAVSTPNGLQLLATANKDAVARTHEILAEVSCTGTANRGGTDVTCTLDKVLLGGQAFPGDEEDLGAILDEYQGMLAGTELQLAVAADGRITLVDLEGIERVDERRGIIIEYLRQLLRRAVTPLDLGLPRKGALVEEWKQKGTPLLFELFTAYGTSGGRVLKHHLDSVEGDVAVISSMGRANVATGIDRELAVSEIVNMVGGGRARFDLSGGQILWREVSVTGELTAESVQLGDVSVYALAAWAGRIEDDGSIQGPEGPVGPADR